MKVVTSLALSSNSYRNEEFQFALNANSMKGLVESIDILTEDKGVVQFTQGIDKVRVILTKERPKFRDIINHINTFGEATCCITNADIVFDDTLRFAEFGTDPDLAYCLTRWVPDLDYHQPNAEYTCWDEYVSHRSFDTWIFKTPLLRMKNIGFYMGTMGCDLRFTHELWRAGRKVINPSKKIRTLHVHKSGFRTYSKEDRVLGDYLGIKPTDHTNFDESNLIHGWGEGGIDDFWPVDWKWAAEVEDVEYWGQDIPQHVRDWHCVNNWTGKTRVRPKDMAQAKKDWEIEFQRRCKEDPLYDDKGNWIGHSE